jgi:CubicO group peptidase (beta-lactamase class C family)
VDGISMSNYLLLGLLIEKASGRGYAATLQQDLLSGNGDQRMVVQDAQRPPPPLTAPDDRDDLVPDRHFLPNRAIASAGGAATGIAADATAVACWGYRLYGGLVLSPERTIEMRTPVTDRYGLGTLIVGDGQQNDLDFRLGGLGAIGHPGFLIPGYQALLLVVPDDRLSVAVLTVAPSAVGTVETPIIVADLIDALHS